MSAQPFLTVMLPVYNGQKYLADALDSVLGQPCRDLEVLVLNDGSTDKTLQIARDYERRDPRVHVETHPNYGIGRNRNEGFQFVNGTCLIFLDDDDVLVPGFYTERTKQVIQTLFDHDIEAIVPSRLHANEELTGCYLCKVPLEGLFPGNGEASLNLHKCVFCARQALFTNDFHFIVRRDNPTQLTKVWDVDNMLHVRAEQYAKLVEWHREHGTTGVVLDEMVERARQAQAELDAYQPRNVGPIERMRELARAKKDHRQWVKGMEPLSNYFYEGSPEAEASLERALESILKIAGIQ